MSKISIYQGVVPDAQTELVAALRTTAIHTATVTNISAADATLQVWVAQDGGAAGNSNKIHHGLTITAGDAVPVVVMANHAMPTGAKLYAQASAADALVLTVSGVEA